MLLLLCVRLSYGTAEQLRAVLARAVQYCDAEKVCFSLIRSCISRICFIVSCSLHRQVYFQMCAIYERSRPEAAEECFALMCKKFKHNVQVWLRFATFRLTVRHDKDGARALLQRALQVRCL